MTGKTHIAVSGASVGVMLAVGKVSFADSAKWWDSYADARTMPLREPYLTVFLLVIGIVAGLFPDLDTPNAELQCLPDKVASSVRRLAFALCPRRFAAFVGLLVGAAILPIRLLVDGLGRTLRVFTGHRGLTHTLLAALLTTLGVFLIVVALVGNVWLAVTLSVVWLVGYTGHLAADACTPSGIPLLWGMAFGRLCGSTFHLLPRRMLVVTGSMVDMLVVRWTCWVVCGLASGIVVVAN